MPRSIVTHLGHLVLKINEKNLFSIEAASVTGWQIWPALTNIDILDFTTQKKDPKGKQLFKKITRYAFYTNII